MAQFGSALDWGSRGRWFKSSQPDEETPVHTGVSSYGQHPIPSEGQLLGNYGFVFVYESCDLLGRIALHVGQYRGITIEGERCALVTESLLHDLRILSRGQ